MGVCVCVCIVHAVCARALVMRRASTVRYRFHSTRITYSSCISYGTLSLRLIGHFKARHTIVTLVSRYTPTTLQQPL